METIKMILEIVGAFYFFISSVALITPTKKDDKIVSYLDRFGWIADKFGVRWKKVK